MHEKAHGRAGGEVRESRTGNEGAMKELTRKILAARSIVLTTHEGPDGDGLGSLAALGLALESHGYRVLRAILEPLPARYRFLDPDGKMRPFDRISDAEKAGPWDLGLILDTHMLAMVGSIGPWLQGLGVPLYYLDHHPRCNGREEHRPEIYGDVNAAATGELVYRLLHNYLGWSIPPEVAEPIYVAISFDTNSFKYIRCNPSSLLIAADLVSRGVDTNRVYRNLFASNSLEKARLLGWALSSVRFECEGRLAYVLIPHSVVRELHLERDELRDSITHILEIQGVEVAATLKEMDPGQVKISLRSKGRCRINEIAARMGGGGHDLAAGCDFSGTVEAAWEALRAALTEVCETG
jgi:phosphoesterase RecJ-like protein